MVGWPCPQYYYIKFKICESECAISSCGIGTQSPDCKMLGQNRSMSIGTYCMFTSCIIIQSVGACVHI